MKQTTAKIASRVSRRPHIALSSPSTVRRVISDAHKAESNAAITSQNQNSASSRTAEDQPQTKVDDEKKLHSQKHQEKSPLELDEELRLKMSGIAGDGGEAGVEYEDGKPVAMKRGVRDNMFRYI